MEALALKFTIQSPDRVQELCVDSENARIGSGSHCEIRLDSQDAAVEQLWVSARTGGVFAEARSLKPPMLLNGSAFVQGRLLPDSLLKLGRVTISVDVVERHLLGSHRAGSTPASRRVLYVLAGIGVPLAIVLVGMGVNTSMPNFEVPAQSLFEGEGGARCPESDRRAARARADELSVQAESGRERTAFSPDDGVRAVDLYSGAAACYALAGASPNASQASRDADALKHELSARFHVHQVRLERALSTGRYEQARLEVRTLLSFLKRRHDAYTEWLGALDRQLIAKSSE